MLATSSKLFKSGLNFSKVLRLSGSTHTFQQPQIYQRFQQVQLLRQFTTNNGLGGIEHQVIPEDQVTDNTELKKEVSGEKVKKPKIKQLSKGLKDKMKELTTDSSQNQEQRKTAKMAAKQIAQIEGQQSSEGSEESKIEKEPKAKKIREKPPIIEELNVPKVSYKDRVQETGINEAIKNLRIEGTTIVRTRQDAKRVVQILRSMPDRVHAWDTETIEIDAKEQSPVGNGKIICASVFIGPDIDFGSGPRLFIDNYADAQGVIMEFKEYLEDPKYLKCFHNYGYDRHIFFNHGINVQGFGGDTMHMARLFDPSKMPNQYALSALSEIMRDDIVKTRDLMIQHWKELYKNDPKAKQRLDTIQLYQKHADKIQKVNIKETFGFYRALKDGTEGKILIFPDIEEMHTDEKYVTPWVEYSTFDAEITYFLRETLAFQLSCLETREEGLSDMGALYAKYWLPFGELLTDMERVGIRIDLNHLKEAELTAERDKIEYEQKFLSWVHKLQDDAHEFNPSSPQQLQQLLFAPFNKKKNEKKPFRAFGQGEIITELQPEAQPTDYEFPVERLFRVENLTGYIKDGKKEPLKYREMKIKGLGIPPVDYTVSGMPAADSPVIKILAGDPDKGKYGKAYDHFVSIGKEQEGKECCEALSNWLKYKQIETLLSTYLIPLQSAPDSKGRVHCSMNLNTETGRLSCRKPNLQNQPALDKDKYKIRKAFVAEKGNKLIVADYGQLELRVLAHMTDCKGMIEAFKLGGDFHSRTALGMYPEIKQEIDAGNVILEWDSSKGKSPVPLLKDKFANERKKAKIMNFSIAYGKTVHGFSQDWGCSIEEAQQTVDLWYADRPEVLKWQQEIKKVAMEKGWTQTLLGRYRNLKKHLGETTEKDFKARGKQEHGLRAAINTPIQGGAADIVIAAMVKLHRDQYLKELGFKLLLQIHDEVILEGPEDEIQEALQRVLLIMENPLDYPLRVKLEVDAKIANNWYEGK